MYVLAILLSSFSISPWFLFVNSGDKYISTLFLLKLLLDRVPIIANDYGMGGINIPILPEYPSDLTDLEKPSIIMRKVDTRQSKVGLGNVLGQHYDNELGGYVDVVGKIHDIMVQFDIVSSNNTNVSILQSLIADDILNKISSAINDCSIDTLVLYSHW